MLKTFRKKIFKYIRSIVWEDWMDENKYFGGGISNTGETVTKTTSLNISAVWGATQFLARTMAALPLKVFKKTEAGKEPDPEHPVYKLLYLKPNPEMSAYQWRSLIMVDVCLDGNHYAEIQRNYLGEPAAIWPLTNSRVTPFRNTKKQLRYQVRMPDGTNDVILAPHQIIHLKGLSNDGIVGMSVLTAAREVFGLALACQSSAGTFFKNGSQLSGVLEHPGTKNLGLTDEGHDRVRKSWEDTHKGIPQAHRIAILEEGMTFKPISISPQDAQLLGSRKFSNQEIARFFGIPLHKIQDLEKATNNNIEHQSIETVTDSILPYTVNFEQEFQIKLFDDDEFLTHYPKHVLQGLLRGDTETRYKGYHIARMDGFMNADEIRRLEDMNDLPDGLGKKYYIPMNMEEVGNPKLEDNNAK